MVPQDPPEQQSDSWTIATVICPECGCRTANPCTLNMEKEYCPNLDVLFDNALLFGNLNFDDDEE